jgi:hypothetical protein
MATNTYVALDTRTLLSNSASVEFTSIPQGYTDLILVCNAKNQGGANYNLYAQVGNGSYDTGSNYSDTYLGGQGSSAFSGRDTSVSQMRLALFGNSNFTPSIIHFQNYSNTTTNKTVISRGSDAGGNVMAIVNLWRSTSAINQIKVFAELSANLSAGSTFTLYGIANSNIGAPKAFGGTITQDATYTYHTFGASGTFTPQQSLTCDYLVVGGGGGGGGSTGAGGGAGGFRTSIGGSALSVTATPYTITVGAGGTGVAGGNGNSGTSSIFSTITSVGGGGGAGSGNGIAGGSGGGGGYVSGTGGAASPSGQGNTGGNAGGYASGDEFSSGGGGGAGAVGGNGGLATGGLGGNGLTSVFAIPTGTGVATYYAGGGGGGTTGFTGSTAGVGGLGGGGAGNRRGVGSPVAGTTNTGGGGGGNATISGTGAAGGSGIVIVRYAN